MVAINYDLSQTDLNSDSIVSGLGDLLLANNYDAQLELMNPMTGATGGTNRDKYEGPPDMQLIAWDGPVKSAVEAMGVLGVVDFREPLPGMAFSLTPEQLLAAASIWYMVRTLAILCNKHVDSSSSCACISFISDFTAFIRNSPAFSRSQADNPFEQTSGFMLCNSVGMGKTCAALTVFVRDQRGGQAIKPTMILAPAGIQFAVWMVSTAWGSNVQGLCADRCGRLRADEIRKHTPSLVDRVSVVTTPEEWKAFIELDSRVSLQSASGRFSGSC
jgi:hypothetical protein